MSPSVKAGLAVALGWVILPIPCLVRAWTVPYYISIKPLPGRAAVDLWRWKWLNSWYGNVEDGVSGQQARIWNTGGTALIPYASTFPSWVPQAAIAFAWSVWRNPANMLKRPLSPHVPQIPQ